MTARKLQITTAIVFMPQLYLARSERRQRHALVQDDAELSSLLHLGFLSPGETPADQTGRRADAGADRQAFPATGDRTDNRSAGRPAADELHISVRGLLSRNRALVVGLRVVLVEVGQRAIHIVHGSVGQPEVIEDDINRSHPSIPLRSLHCRHASANHAACWDQLNAVR